MSVQPLETCRECAINYELWLIYGLAKNLVNPSMLVIFVESGESRNKDFISSVHIKIELGFIDYTFKLKYWNIVIIFELDHNWYFLLLNVYI